METLAPSLWIDNNVVDCWGAILNYEESAKKDPSPKKNAKKAPLTKRHFFPTGCITEAMVQGTIGKGEQWDIFSAEISAHLKNVDASKFLAEIELAFFPIQVSGHFYVVVFNIKKSVTSMIILDNSPQSYVAKYKDACDLLKEFFARFLLEHAHPKSDNVMNVKGRVLHPKWKTNNNHVDCRVFAMIHMESYVGETVKNWDVGLCQESDMQVWLLRRMRFKIATKILLHELNLHSQKMYDLAFKFQEIDEQTRISIIVNAIKNRADRDPEKVVRKVMLKPDK
ncbi:Peptidase C48, SUMO/Sentrin/Ubl1 [Artemisia annua]|uniref:Peptidase C48, SUMO/Sentrin/Ubl1 n=1 Tax=Artemisia annua TaxID=35608 RepID=A0A2U1PZ10_ARTAN|nr:Peptidase C48, SUMO/Sentrin/Ubl1 [Artemisia annua]